MLTPESVLLKGGVRGGFGPDQAHVYDWQPLDPTAHPGLGGVSGLGAEGGVQDFLKRLGPVGTGIASGLASGILRSGIATPRALAVPAVVGAGLGYLAKQQGVIDIGITKLDIRGNPFYVAVGVFLATMFMPIPSGD